MSTRDLRFALFSEYWSQTTG